MEVPLADNKMKQENIHPVFWNPFQKDVSREYFEISDVLINLAKPEVKDNRYCYLYIFQNKGFSPVQWGKIDRLGKVVFKDMGRDIVYFPMYYRQGALMQAADPFLLTTMANVRH